MYGAVLYTEKLQLGTITIILNDLKSVSAHEGCI